MNASTDSQALSPNSVGGAPRSFITPRRALIVAALLIVAAGLYLGWGWLAAAGIAPVLLALAPCAAMCAAGVCMGKMGGESCAGKSDLNLKGNRNA